MKFGSELQRRRVLHAISFYVAASWGIVEFVDWLVRRYELQPEFVDATLFGLTSLIPAILVVTWYHGAKGRDRWGMPEIVAVPLNVLLTIGIVGWVLASVSPGD